MSLLGSKFAMKDLGPLSIFFGIAVTRHSHGLFLSQKQYATKIIERVGMSNCSLSPTPVDTKSKLSANSGTPFNDPTKYRSLAGALQYLTFTRPNISYAVQQVCLHMHAPTIEHMSALKRIIRYCRVHFLLDYIYITLPLIGYFLIQMQTGLDVQILVVLHPGIVLFLVII